VRAAVDVMGGDKAPQQILKGCWGAAPLLDGEDRIILIGDQAVIQPALDEANLTADQKARYQVVHTTQIIAMDESPVEAVRSKPDSSIAVMCKMASKKEADVVISAGNTGACVAASQLRMRTLKGISRPGIATVVPTPSGPIILCDVGANQTENNKN
jgi:glycerol-3-phosphate acyltransferase PlsX